MAATTCKYAQLKAQKFWGIPPNSSFIYSGEIGRTLSWAKLAHLGEKVSILPRVGPN